MGTKEKNHDRGISDTILIAMPWWLKPKRDKGEDPNPKLTELMQLLFRTLDALYLETKKLPFYARGGANKRPKNNPDSFIFALWLKDADYATLRSILALCGDLISVLEKLMTLSGLLDIGALLPPLHKRANQFRDA